MNIPVTFLHDDSADRFLIPVRVVSAPTHGKLTELVHDGLFGQGRRPWSVQLPHRRFRRRQRARLRLAAA
jgi:hypothetical protein